MKVTSPQLRKIILESILKEMAPVFPIETLDDAQHLEKRGLDIEKGFQLMINNQLGNIGLAKIIMKYLNPYRDKLKIHIRYNENESIEVLLKHYGKTIGETSANKNEYDPEIFTVAWGGILSGRDKPIPTRFNKVDKIFLEKGYGPITYEIAIEFLSMKGYGLTSDRESVSEDAYDIWDYYYNNRSDVQKRLIDYNKEQTGYGQYSPLTISAEIWYGRKTGRVPDKMSLLYDDTFGTHDNINPLATDHDLRRMYIDYLNNESPIMQSYTKKDRPFIAAIRDMGMLYINNKKIEPGGEII